MSEKEEKNTDREIADRIDTLFESLPDLQTEEEVNAFLSEAGYDPDTMGEEGVKFVEKIMSKNWRFVTEKTIEEEASIFEEIPLRIGMGKEWLIRMIQQNAAANFQYANRNFEGFTEKELASILRDIEANLIQHGKKLKTD